MGGFFMQIPKFFFNAFLVSELAKNRKKQFHKKRATPKSDPIFIWWKIISPDGCVRRLR